jgi:hypothetical protein
MTVETVKTNTVIQILERNGSDVEQKTPKTDTHVLTYVGADDLIANLAVDGTLENPLDNGKDTIRDSIDYNYELITQLQQQLEALQAQVDAIVSCTCTH